MEARHFTFNKEGILSILPIKQTTEENIRHVSREMCRAIIAHYSTPRNTFDLSIYTGIAGAVYGVWKYQQCYHDDSLSPSPEEMLLRNWDKAKHQLRQQGKYVCL
ncbi:hypothetical protein EON63_01250 [archaeon]|nr:MAG: hypothetical protein EON63_01250 [archaeon]